MDYKIMFKKLNEYQKKAVYDHSRACIVNANVGSGKTTVLISKILYLHHEKQIEYQNMIVLTFTNKAADEIKARLKEQESDLNIKELRNFGTFHSVALHYLRSYLPVEELGFTKDFQVIEPDEEIEIAMQLIREHCLTIKYKNRLKKRLEQEDYDRYQDDILELRRLLQEEKIKQNKMTFSDLLYIAVHLLETCDDAEYTAPDWIIIDEVQDSDSTQLQLIDALMGKTTSLFAVGDPNQIIYSWRGSESNVFRKLIEKYNATELSLPVNYRSSSAILEAAKRFQQTDHDLIGVRDTGSRIIVRNHYDSFQEAEYLVDRIQEIHASGVPYHEIAIFYRLQNQSEVFEKVFTKNEIPYEVSVKKNIQDYPVLDWVSKLLRCAVNQQDRYAYEFCLNHKVYGPGKNKAQKAQRDAFLEKIQKFTDVFQVVSRESEDTEHGDVAISSQELEVHVSSQKLKTSVSSQNLYEYFALDDRLHPTAASYREDKQLVFTFFEAMFHFISEHKLNFIEGVTEYVNSAALYGMKALMKQVEESKYIKQMEDTKEIKQTEDTKEIKQTDDTKEIKQTDVHNAYNQSCSLTDDSVQLMTLHASKGLEFSYVFITGVNYGVIPLRARTFEEEDEERRLFFVGITRAKDHLELSYYTNPDTPRSVSGPSSFIRILPRQLVENGQIRQNNESSMDGETLTINKTVVQSNELFDDLFAEKPKVDLHELKRQIVTEKRNAAIAFRGIVGNEITCSQPDACSEEKHSSHADDHVPRQASHEKYGVGTIVKEDDMMITVEFEGYGEKEFIKGFGDLTIL